MKTVKASTQVVVYLYLKSFIVDSAFFFKDCEIYDIAKQFNWPERREVEFESNSGAAGRTLQLLTYANREITHRVFFSRERQRGSHDLTFPAFAVCRRGGHFSRLEETRKREYLQLGLYRLLLHFDRLVL